MLNLLSIFHKQRLWNFPGIHPQEMKIQSSKIPLRSVPLPDKLIIHLKQHLGPPGELKVAVGEKVLRGQPLTSGKDHALPVHASTSGTIIAIIPYQTAHPSGLPELSIILLPDGNDQWIMLNPIENFHNYSRMQLLDRIHESGIAGLGGAGFPVATKINNGNNKVETIIINCAECDPYITADDRLIRDYTDEIIIGIKILKYILQPKRILIGIEDNKFQSIMALKNALHKQPIGEMRIIPTKYPSGGAKQLTKILTGKEIPTGKHSDSIEVLMLNISTVYAIKRAIINGEALTERVITLTGKSLARPGNVWARLGTPVSHLLNQAGFHSNKKSKVIMGGPLMGYILPTLETPVIKTSNCLLAPAIDELATIKTEQNCIRCNHCADVCPINLLPQQLYWFCRGQNHDAARKYHLLDCIECGACAYVCPSNIPLVLYYRQQKAQIRIMENNTKRVQMSKVRFEAKLKRHNQKKRQQITNTQKITKKRIITTIINGKQLDKIIRKALLIIKSINKYIKKTKTYQQVAKSGCKLLQHKNPVSTYIRTKQNNNLTQLNCMTIITNVTISPSCKQVNNTTLSPEEHININTKFINSRKEIVTAAIARVKARRQANQDKITLLQQNNNSQSPLK